MQTKYKASLKKWKTYLLNAYQITNLDEYQVYILVMSTKTGDMS